MTKARANKSSSSRSGSPRTGPHNQTLFAKFVELHDSEPEIFQRYYWNLFRVWKASIFHRRSDPPLPSLPINRDWSKQVMREAVEAGVRLEHLAILDLQPDEKHQMIEIYLKELNRTGTWWSRQELLAVEIWLASQKETT